jgi:hypothetical protein
MMGFEDSLPCSLIILCDQSVLIYRGLHIQAHSLHCSQLWFRFKFVLLSRKEHVNNFERLFDIMLIFRFVYITHLSLLWQPKVRLTNG